MLAAPTLLMTLAVLTSLFMSGDSNPGTTVSVKENEHTPPATCSGKAAKGRKCRLIKVDNIYHVGLVEVGTPKQKIIVIFDTGSSYLWVTSSSYCKAHASYCHNRVTYNHGNSSTFDKKFKTESWKINYLDGEVHGVTAKDHVAVGDVTFKGLIFAEATEIKTDSKVSTITDDKSTGVFGLGFEKESGTHADPPFVTMIKEKLIGEPVFSFYLDRLNHKSHIHFGSVDSGYFLPPLTYTRVTSDRHWEINIDMIIVNKKILAKNVKAVVDSGSSHIVGKKHLMDAIHADVTKSNDMGMYYLNCQNAGHLPVVIFVIEKKPFPLQPGDYVSKKAADHCESGFTAVDEVPSFILGTVWMTRYYTVFEMKGKPRIGFAQSKQMTG